MTEAPKSGYRLNVAMIVFNEENKLYHFIYPTFQCINVSIIFYRT